MALPSSVASVEEICNLAFDACGYPQSIGSILEGSKGARIALRLYGQTRDALLRAKDYTFAERVTTLVTNGQTAPEPWLYEYTWPSDCLKIRQVYPLNPGTFPILDPRPQLQTDYNDGRTTPASKAILANISPAALVYTGQITDFTTWDP
jgi:hypothetical protein